MSHVQKLIDGISDLNPMPRVASQILTLVENPQSLHGQPGGARAV